MNILIITKNYVPSTIPDAKRFDGITSFFASKGHKVTVITETLNATSSSNIRVFNTKPIGKDSHGMLERMINHASFMLQSFFKGLKVGEIDVVIATSPPLFNLISGKYLSKIKKAKFVADIRDIWPDVFEQSNVLNKSNPIYKIFDMISKSSYKAADLIAVVTPGKKDLLVSKFPKYSDKVHLLTNGFNSEILNNPIDEDFKLKFSGTFNIIYTGKVGIAQNLEPFIELAKTHRNNNSMKFHLLGSGKGVDGILKLINDYSLDNITYHGNCNEIQTTTALRMSHIAYVSLANEKLIDSIPTKIYEAFVFGCPILLSAKGDSVDLMNEVNFGLSSLPSNQEELYKNFDLLVENYDSYQIRESEVKEYMLNKYSREVMSKDYLDLISNL